MDSYRKAMVLGLGESGEAAARLLLSEGASVTVIDRSDNEHVRARATRLEAAGAWVLLGADELPSGSFDIAIVSPGIPSDAIWMYELRARGIPVLSELELGWTRRNCPVIAITGSNGKTTMVRLLADSMARAGLRVAYAGNGGPPISDVVREQFDLDWLVLEVSSFQLETCVSFRPDIGVLLNLHPNHLDRHADMDEYLQAKCRLFQRSAVHDLCIVPRTLHQRISKMAPRVKHWITFGEREGTYRLDGDMVYCDQRPVLELAQTIFSGGPLAVNLAAMAAAMEGCGMTTLRMREALAAFRGLPHRLQRVGECDGVSFVNDSKATNLAALQAALQHMHGPVHLIAGGMAKEKDWESIKEVLAEKVRCVYLIGRAADDMFAAWSGTVTCVRSETLDHAMEHACRDARIGDTILLSPACASFDQFRSYEERGQAFIDFVANRVKEGSLCRTNSLGVK